MLFVCFVAGQNANLSISCFSVSHVGPGGRPSFLGVCDMNSCHCSNGGVKMILFLMVTFQGPI